MTLVGAAHTSVANMHLGKHAFCVAMLNANLRSVNRPKKALMKGDIDTGSYEIADHSAN